MTPNLRIGILGHGRFGAALAALITERRRCFAKFWR